MNKIFRSKRHYASRLSHSYVQGEEAEVEMGQAVHPQSRTGKDFRSPAHGTGLTFLLSLSIYHTSLPLHF